MIIIPCPYCGRRDEAEFSYRGDATATRPRSDDGFSDDGFFDYVYTRANPRGWHQEWWQHTQGCRAVLKVLRHTVTHEVRAAVPANADLPPP